MAVTFDEARRIVYDDVRRTWKRGQGTLVTLPNGFQDDRYWQVVAGAKEWLIDHDPGFELMDAPALLVDKNTGAVKKLTVLEAMDRLNKMSPV